MAGVGAIALAACSNPAQPRRAAPTCDNPRRPCDLLLPENVNRMRTPYLPDSNTVFSDGVFRPRR